MSPRPLCEEKAVGERMTTRSSFGRAAPATINDAANNAVYGAPNDAAITNDGTLYELNCDPCRGARCAP